MSDVRLKTISTTDMLCGPFVDKKDMKICIHLFERYNSKDFNIMILLIINFSLRVNIFYTI